MQRDKAIATQESVTRMGVCLIERRETKKQLTHPQAEADEAPARRRDNLKASVSLNEAHKQLAQVDVMPEHMHANSQHPGKNALHLSNHADIIVVCSH
jgi:hypothetical protein